MGLCTWQEALDYCEDLSYGGYGNWRLASYHELHSLVDFGRKQPAIDTEAFTDYFPHSYYRFWTSSTNVNSPEKAWYVYFSFGHNDYSLKTIFSYTRCVRLGYSPQGPGAGERYIITETTEEEPVVTDLVTGLAWQQLYWLEFRPWRDALSHCENLDYGGFQDWRLPNIKELVSLLKINSYQPATEFPCENLARLWSSSSVFENDIYAYNIAIHVGSAKYHHKTDLDNYPYNLTKYARCVRGGP